MPSKDHSCDLLPTAAVRYVNETMSDGRPADPARAAAARAAAIVAPSVKQALYLTEAGTTTAISVADIHQGQIGDCFLLAAIGELALFHPSALGGMIRGLADGTETVTLYADRYAHLPWYASTSFRAVSVKVSNVFPGYAVNGGAAQGLVGGVKEIWPQVLEKAVATQWGGYGAIANGGSPVQAMETLTGQRASWQSPQSLSLASLQDDIARRDLIVMDTPDSGSLPYDLVGNHAYMFDQLSFSHGMPMVTLLNPWGFHQPAPIPLASLSKAIAEVDVGHVA